MPQLPAVGAGHNTAHGSVAAGYRQSPAHSPHQQGPGQAAAAGSVVGLHLVALAPGKPGGGALVLLFAEFYGFLHDIKFLGHLVIDFLGRLFQFLGLVLQHQLTDFFAGLFGGVHQVFNGVIF